MVEFLEQKWSVKVIRNFLLEVNNAIYAIKKQPLMCPYLSEKKEVHKCVIKKKTLLLYKVSPTQIELLKFIDTRQNPSKYNF